MDLENIMLNEISQAKKDRYRFHLYVELRTNTQTKQTQNHRNRDQKDGCQKRGGRERVKSRRGTLSIIL